MADLPDPPIAPRRPHALITHGDERSDDWYWLRDRDDSEVLAYLEAENAYTTAAMAHTEALQERVFQEFKHRIVEDDESPPTYWGGHWYSTRTVEGREYEIHVRRTGSVDAPEQVLLDENELAAGKEFFDLRALEVSPDHSRLAYATNYDGTDVADFHFRDIDGRRDFDDRIEQVSGAAVWANDNETVFYIAREPVTLRSHQVWRYRLGDPMSATLIYEEPDTRYSVGIDRTKSGRYIVLTSYNSTSTEVRVLEADRPESDFRLIEARRPMLRYFVEHHGDRFLIVTDADGAVNHKLVAAPVHNPGAANWRDVIPHRDDVRLYSGIEVFKDFVVVSERTEAVRGIRAIRLADNTSIPIEMPEQVSVAVPGENPEFDSCVFRFEYSSFVTPESVFDVDLRTGERTLVKQQPVRDFEPTQYETERQWATADDGALVPISLVQRKGLARDGLARCVLYGYGSYEASMDPSFSPFVVSLLDRGVIFAIAHIRGGGEMGRGWYEDGKFLRKTNTFTDFVACGDHLIDEGYTSSARMVAMGGSAGGLLMGAVVNMRPDLFHAVLALVPFVDVVTTMLDESIPLTTGEFEEWGNPNDVEYYEYMKSYSPYDNVEAKDYPAMLVTAGLNDPRVAYWEPAKWVAKLRATKTDPNELLLKTELGAGHSGPSGRYGEWHERAFWYAWMIDQLGLT